MSMLEKMARAVRDNYADDHGEEDYQRIAVAVLQAIREPDEATSWKGACVEVRVTGYEDCPNITESSAERVFTAMIDAILNPGTET